MAASSKPIAGHDAVDEITPLLAASAAGQPTQGDVEAAVHSTTEAANGYGTTRDGSDGLNADRDDDDDDDDERPLNMKQILLICYARMVEPMAFFCIFPFVPQMIKNTGNIPEADTGFYTGLIESLFSVTQMVLMLGWGRGADRFGRKPVLVFSLMGMAIFTTLFGFSRNVTEMIVLRCMAGMFGGTLVTIRTMISENSTPKTQARAFSLFAFAGNLGIFLGPLLGGVLAEPAKTLPSTLGRIRLFQEYPFALPTLVTGSLAASAALVSALFVTETLERKHAGGGPAAKPMASMDILKSRNVPLVLYIFGLTMVIGMAYTAILPVVFFTSPKLGGWGFSPQWISYAMGAFGFGQSAWLLLIFPPLQRRIGTVRILRICSVWWALLMVAYPLSNQLLRWHMEKVFWIAVPIGVLVASGVAMNYTACQLLLNDVSPSPNALGTLNAMALTMSSGLRAISPGLFASLYAFGVRTQILGGHLIWAVLCCLAVILSFSSCWVPVDLTPQAEETNTPQSPVGPAPAASAPANGTKR